MAGTGQHRLRSEIGRTGDCWHNRPSASATTFKRRLASSTSDCLIEQPVQRISNSDRVTPVILIEMPQPHQSRDVEVADLLAMRAPYRPQPAVAKQACKSCGGPLPLGARRGNRFCGKRCAAMTPSQRAGYVKSLLLKTPQNSLRLKPPPPRLPGQRRGQRPGRYSG